MPRSRDDKRPPVTGKAKMFRKRLQQGTRPEIPPLDQPAEPAPHPAEPVARPAEPATPRSPTALPKDIVAPSPRRASMAELARSPGRNLVVGRDIALNGEIADCEKLVIEGQVEGEISDTRRLEIAESGRFKGRATVQDCVVAGVCEGEITVNGLLTVRPKGRISGTLRYVEVLIERGGRLSGDIDIEDPRAAATQEVATQEADSQTGAAAGPDGAAPGEPSRPA